jgi:hypothetical protein
MWQLMYLYCQSQSKKKGAVSWLKAVSRRPLTAETRVRARVNPCEICGGQSATGTGFSPSSSVFPCQYHPTIALQTHIIWGTNNMSVSGSSS